MNPQPDDKRDADADAESATSEPDELQPMRFDIFVLSLNASALIHLGDKPGDSPTGTDAARVEVDLPLARQTIDILGMLEEKTRGNLTGEEERLLHQVLFDLRMRFTRAAKQ